MSRYFTIIILSLTAFASSYTYSQIFRSRSISNQPEPPQTEFIAARWHFGTNGDIGHMGWSHNYPESDLHLNDFLKRSTRIDLEDTSFLIVELGSEKVFDHPFAYVSEPGEMELTDQEVINLREFILKGGFVLMDDFDGPWQWAQMASQVRRAFPENNFVPLSIDEPIFQIVNPMDDFQDMANYVPGGTITYYGLYNPDGNLGILAGHNNDLANFWDWYSDGTMPLLPSTDAFRLGANAVIYAMTH
jgi:hypothetical protein